jgi:hypothetical protein
VDSFFGELVQTIFEVRLVEAISLVIGTRRKRYDLM